MVQHGSMLICADMRDSMLLQTGCGEAIPRLPRGPECTPQDSCSAAHTRSAASEQEDLALDMLLMQVLEASGQHELLGS